MASKRARPVGVTSSVWISKSCENGMAVWAPLYHGRNRGTGMTPYVQRCTVPYFSHSSAVNRIDVECFLQNEETHNVDNRVWCQPVEVNSPQAGYVCFQCHGILPAFSFYKVTDTTWKNRFISFNPRMMHDMFMRMTVEYVHAHDDDRGHVRESCVCSWEECVCPFVRMWMSMFMFMMMMMFVLGDVHGPCLHVMMIKVTSNAMVFFLPCSICTSKSVPPILLSFSRYGLHEDNRRANVLRFDAMS